MTQTKVCTHCGSNAKPRDEDTIKQALSVLTDDMLFDLVEFCESNTAYRESDLHELAEEELRERNSNV